MNIELFREALQMIRNVAVPAFGCTEFPTASQTAGTIEAVSEALPKTIEARHYSVSFSPDGLMESMTGDDGNAVIVNADDQSPGYLGGEIRAVADGLWVDNRGFECSFRPGPVCAVLQRTGAIAGVPLAERYLFFLNEPLVKVHLSFAFDASEIGDFHILETKLNVYYPTTGSDAHHDIPFGYSTCGDGEQAFARPWTSQRVGDVRYVTRRGGEQRSHCMNAYEIVKAGLQ